MFLGSVNTLNTAQSGAWVKKDDGGSISKYFVRLKNSTGNFISKGVFPPLQTSLGFRQLEDNLMVVWGGAVNSWGGLLGGSPKNVELPPQRGALVTMFLQLPLFAEVFILVWENEELVLVSSLYWLLILERWMSMFYCCFNMLSPTLGTSDKGQEVQATNKKRE